MQKQQRPPLMLILVWGLLLLIGLVTVLFLLSGFLAGIIIVTGHYGGGFTPHPSHI